MISVVGKLAGSVLKIGLYMFNNGGRALKYINQENYFPKYCQISDYFDTKYTIVVQIQLAVTKI